MLNRPTRSLVLAAVACSCFGGAIMSSAPAAQSRPAVERPSAAAASRHVDPAGQIEHGRYIVTRVSRCVECHTPRDSDGALLESRLLMGAPVPYLPARPIADWPTMCPRIGGTPPGTDEQILTLLTTGLWKDGAHLRPPMPQFRMTREDADAVLAFLKSLPSS